MCTVKAPLPALTELGLHPAPDWQATRDAVAKHFPAGCEVCGVWVRVGGDDSAQRIVEVLCQTTDLLVRPAELLALFPALSESLGMRQL